MKNQEMCEGLHMIKDLHKGDFFRLKPDAKRVYVRGEYDRSEKRYECIAFDDIGYSRMFDGKRQVYAGFTF